MNKVSKRLLTFFIGLPLVIAIVFFDYLNHLSLQILVAIISMMGANEFYNMAEKKTKLFPRPLTIVATGLIPVFCYLFILLELSLDISPWILVTVAVILMAIECISAKTFEDSFGKIAYTLLCIFYCGYLFTFISRMTILPDSKYIISLFLIFVFMCDSAAWFFGVLFGKGTRGFIAASPNKSIVGFIGGLAGSIASGVLFKYFCPEVFTISYLNLVILGLLTALAAIVGDLVESVFKRSCDVKDSGNIMPGRGGILDSIDSIVIAAPVFYIGYSFLF